MTDLCRPQLHIFHCSHNNLTQCTAPIQQRPQYLYEKKMLEFSTHIQLYTKHTCCFNISKASVTLIYQYRTKIESVVKIRPLAGKGHNWLCYTNFQHSTLASINGYIMLDLLGLLKLICHSLSCSLLSHVCRQISNMIQLMLFLKVTHNDQAQFNSISSTQKSHFTLFTCTVSCFKLLFHYAGCQLELDN